jgi:Family of unknown function (DUF6758)
MPDRPVVVDPFAAVINATMDGLPVPLWVPWPPPEGWAFSGLVHGRVTAGIGSGTTGCWSGVDPFGDPVEVLLVCEEAGAGLGGLFAGLPTHYPTPEVGVGPPHARLQVEGRPVSLWKLDGVDDRAVYVGEAAGCWLWVIVHPAEGSALVISPLTLVDARRLNAELAVLPLGELSPRLLVEVPPET